MVTKTNIRDAASTLAWHWSNNSGIDRQGVERVILSYPETTRPVLCASILLTLQDRGEHVQAAAFENLLFNFADIQVEA